MFGGDWLDRIIVQVKRKSLESHYRTVFDSDSGRIVLNDLSKMSQLMEFRRESKLGEWEYEAGKRDLLLYLMWRLRIRPQDTQQLADREIFDD